MLKKILLGLLVVVLLFVGFVASRPSDFRIERSASISAPPDIVFPLINNLQNLVKWSPWEGLDPNQQRKFEGPESGTGAIYSWSGNDKVGEGRMTILESKPNELVRIDIEFIKPFENRSLTEFKIQQQDNGVNVTWAMTGKRNFVSKAICLFMDMDQMIGGNFEKGLALLKSQAESAEKSAAAVAVPTDH